jgi:hypothetical protein
MTLCQTPGKWELFRILSTSSPVPGLCNKLCESHRVSCLALYVVAIIFLLRQQQLTPLFQVAVDYASRTVDILFTQKRFAWRRWAYRSTLFFSPRFIWYEGLGPRPLWCDPTICKRDGNEGCYTTQQGHGPCFRLPSCSSLDQTTPERA